MDKETKQINIDALLTTYRILEDSNVNAALEGCSELRAAKGIVARLVIMISNATTVEEGE